MRDRESFGFTGQKTQPNGTPRAPAKARARDSESKRDDSAHSTNMKMSQVYAILQGFRGPF